LLVYSPTALKADSFTVNVAGNNVGDLPWVITAFANGTDSTADVYPIGATTDYYYFSLYDTGATNVFLTSDLKGTSGIAEKGYNDLRINGFSQIDETTLYAPIYTGYEASVENSTFGTSTPDKILLGGPVTTTTSAKIDYTNPITRGPYSVVVGGYITVNSSGSPDSRTMMTGGSLNGTLYDSYGFLYDTGTTVNIMSQTLAEAAFGYPLTPTIDLFPNYTLASLEIAGISGTGVANFINVPIVVLADADTRLGVADAIIGSNLFADTSLIFDGPGRFLHIEAPSVIPEPSAFLLLGTGLGALALMRFRRRNN
jgi:hypothetical protein